MPGHYYSVKAFSDRDVSFPEYMVAVGKGTNVFTLTTENIQKTVQVFLDNGVRIIEAIQLDGLEAFNEPQLSEKSG